MSSPGRPRLVDRRRPGATPAEEILDAAAELFATRGYTATSTRAIAEAVGLRQASLYTHFPTKAAILAALLATTVGPTLDEARELVDGAGEPADTLLGLATVDVTGLLAPRWNIGALYLLPEIASGEFAEFRAQRAELRAVYRDLAARCRPDLDAHDPLLDLPFRVVESVILHRQDVPDDEVDARRWAAAALRAIGVG